MESATVCRFRIREGESEYCDLFFCWSSSMGGGKTEDGCKDIRMYVLSTTDTNRTPHQNDGSEQAVVFLVLLVEYGFSPRRSRCDTSMGSSIKRPSQVCFSVTQLNGCVLIIRGGTTDRRNHIGWGDHSRTHYTIGKLCFGQDQGCT